VLCNHTVNLFEGIAWMLRCVNEYGALVEKYWQEKLDYREESLPQCHLVQRKRHVDLPEFEPGTAR
jgi:hypothetical protein